jgi:hypothetical protein
MSEYRATRALRIPSLTFAIFRDLLAKSQNGIVTNQLYRDVGQCFI